MKVWQRILSNRNSISKLPLYKPFKKEVNLQIIKYYRQNFQPVYLFLTLLHNYDMHVYLVVKYGALRVVAVLVTFVFTNRIGLLSWCRYGGSCTKHGARSFIHSCNIKPHTQIMLSYYVSNLVSIKLLSEYEISFE